jgi:tetratricopeptide (TPR) repeat protein
MIRHQVYFDTLGSMKEDSASWRSVFAGLSVLRLVDTLVDSGSPINSAGWGLLHSVRSAIDGVNEGDPVRGVLTTVFEEATKRGTVDDTVCGHLLAYGRSLDHEASWGLATDVFATVAKLARPEKNARLAVEANIAVGGAARRNGDWDTSARGYSQAAYIADTLGDKPGVLTVQVGIANTYLAKGNLPQAETILDDVIVQARDQNIPEVQAIALHSRAVIAQKRGNYADGLKLAYDAFNLSTKPTDRDFILEDIGAIFTGLGMRDSARDTHLLLAATSQTQLVRWTATINLMELASFDGMEEAFDSYAGQLATAKCGTWVRSHFLLFLGEGLERLNRFDAAEKTLEEAVAFAGLNQIHEIEFRAQAALSALRSAARSRVSSTSSFVAAPTWVPEDVASVVQAISDLRKAAVAAH